MCFWYVNKVVVLVQKKKCVLRKWKLRELPIEPLRGQPLNYCIMYAYQHHGAKKVMKLKLNFNRLQFQEIFWFVLVYNRANVKLVCLLLPHAIVSLKFLAKFGLEDRVVVCKNPFNTKIEIKNFEYSKSKPAIHCFIFNLSK